MYTIGTLSKNTGVTRRTLDYYDEIGLVKPSSRTSGGHRLYSEDDVMRLERVLALKYMGFSLDKINAILQSSKLNWQESIQEQLDMVKREQERLKMLEQALQGVLYSIEFEEKISWPIISLIMKFYHQEPEELIQQYNHFMNEEEMRKIIECNETMSEEDIREWMKAVYDIKKHQDIDPHSDLALQLAERWLKQAEKMFDHDEQLLGNLWESLKGLEEGVVFYPMDKGVVEFLQKVSKAHGEMG
ncbi:MerR family transcriptional regulator [Ornithinibacillus sp. BX22]|uniref:MerR family transcriptional regulator n=2 Tax=Ornithinibacillus TaxID=484508 RepID=A0A923L2M4_9BACI|nr:MULTISPECIES: MerR family transcriptional regulator [Ornithinibacillus]MBC5635321.1 MerR family transcriptional regulator [Ornithinibacillus hominis]MBS3678890.1 MerR family transcriptional regulator [Ornithinibacillus massiliensis]